MDLIQWLPAATGLGAVVAAILTGFGAAALKNRWDKNAALRVLENKKSELMADRAYEAFRNYRLARQQAESFATTWSVAKRRELAPNPDPQQKDGWIRPVPETELEAEIAKLRVAADLLAFDALSTEAIELVEEDFQVMRSHCLNVINQTIAGGDWSAVAPPQQLTKRMIDDVRDQRTRVAPKKPADIQATAISHTQINPPEAVAPARITEARPTHEDSVG